MHMQLILLFEIVRIGTPLEAKMLIHCPHSPGSSKNPSFYLSSLLRDCSIWLFLNLYFACFRYARTYFVHDLCCSNAVWWLERNCDNTSRSWRTSPKMILHVTVRFLAFSGTVSRVIWNQVAPRMRTFKASLDFLLRYQMLLKTFSWRPTIALYLSPWRSLCWL